MARAYGSGQKKRDSGKSLLQARMVLGCRNAFLEEIFPVCLGYSVGAVIDAEQVKGLA